MDEISEAELVGAVRAGIQVPETAGDQQRGVSAGLLRRICHELQNEVDPRGLILRGAAIVGELDLAGLQIPFPLNFTHCDFDSALRADGAALHQLTLADCKLPGLLGNGLRVTRDLDLSRSVITGGHRTSASTSKRSAIWLCEADIGGRLLALNTAIHADGERAVQADSIHVAGSIRLLHSFEAVGELRFIGGRIDGSLDLTGAQLTSQAGLALDLGEATIGGSVFLVDGPAGQRPVVNGRIDMGSARIAGQFLIRNAILQEPANLPADSGYSRSWVGGTAVSAPRLSVGAEVNLAKGCTVVGTVDLSMSDISSLVIGSGCSVRAAGRTAIDMTHAELRSSLTMMAEARIRGTMRLTGARIHGKLTLLGTLSDPERSSLVSAQGLRVDGAVELLGLRATGGRLRFGVARLGSVVAVAAKLTNPHGYTLSLHHTTIQGSVILARGFESTGLVVLSRSSIGGRLELTGGSFECPGPFDRNQLGHAIEAISATVQGGMHLDWKKIAPSIDLTNARTTFIADDPDNWPPRYVLSGFTYDRFDQNSPRSWTAAARCAWLSQQAPYDAGPYEQAARVFRQHGYALGAEEILIAQRQQARRTLQGRGARLRRARDTLYGLSVGYGYRPGRVLWLLAALLIMMTGSLEVPLAQATMRATASGTVYTTRGRLITNLPAPRHAPGRTDACSNGQVRCFNPALYAIDTVIPLISLGQRATWYPDPRARFGTLVQWWLYLGTVLGWLLSTVFVLSLARLARAPST